MKKVTIKDIAEWWLMKILDDVKKFKTTEVSSKEIAEESCVSEMSAKYYIMKYLDEQLRKRDDLSVKLYSGVNGKGTVLIVFKKQ